MRIIGMHIIGLKRNEKYSKDTPSTICVVKCAKDERYLKGNVPKVLKMKCLFGNLQIFLWFCLCVWQARESLK